MSKQEVLTVITYSNEMVPAESTGLVSTYVSPTFGQISVIFGEGGGGWRYSGSIQISSFHPFLQTFNLEGGGKPKLKVPKSRKLFSFGGGGYSANSNPSSLTIFISRWWGDSVHIMGYSVDFEPKCQLLQQACASKIVSQWRLIRLCKERKPRFPNLLLFSIHTMSHNQLFKSKNN